MDLSEIKEFFIDTFKYVVMIALIIFIVVYVCSLQQVVGPSMEPNLNTDDILLLDKVTYRFRKPKRYEVITFKLESKQYLVKRVIGLPGENVEYKDNQLYINGTAYNEEFITDLTTEDFSLKDLGYDVIPEDMYLVLGDNREDSLDSRKFGLISTKDIIGKPFLRVWPINKIKFVH